MDFPIPTGPGPAPASLEGFPGRALRLLDQVARRPVRVADAALCSPSPVGSVPSLSLEPVFRRSHGSLYKALSFAQWHEDAVRRACS